LELGLREIQERRRQNPTRAVLELIGMLADDCSVLGGDQRFDWNEDAFLFEAFQITVSMLLKHLPKPKGESALTAYLATAKNIPDVSRKIFGSAESFADHIFLKTWFDLLSVRPMPKRQAEQEYGLNPEEALEWERLSHNLYRVRRHYFGQS